MAPETPHDDPADAAALRARIDDLQRRLTEYQAVLDALPVGVFWKDTDLVYRGCNRITLAATGYTDRADYVGNTDADMPWTPAQTEAFLADDREVMASRRAKPGIVEEVSGLDGGSFWVETYKAPVISDTGELLGVLGCHRDVTARRRAEDDAAAAHRQALRELATPLLPVADGVLVMPLIGVLDPERCDMVTQTLLAGVVQHRAAVAILDVTGLHTIDTTAADGLVRAARAVRLLGAQTVVTGIRPSVVQILVGLGVDLGDFPVLADLKAGIAYAIARPR